MVAEWAAATLAAAVWAVARGRGGLDGSGAGGGGEGGGGLRADAEAEEAWVRAKGVGWGGGRFVAVITNEIFPFCTRELSISFVQRGD